MHIGRNQHNHTGVLTKICNILFGYGSKQFQLLRTSHLQGDVQVVVLAWECRQSAVCDEQQGSLRISAT